MIYIKRIFKSQFVGFAIVGALGTITNLIIFFIFVDVIKFNPIIISIIAFLIAVTQNYILNHKWTFKNRVADKKLSFEKYIKFIMASLLGLAVNLLVLKLILRYYDLPLKVIAQATGILAGMTVNFVISKFYVFK